LSFYFPFAKPLSFLNNQYVHTKVAEILKELKINVYESYQMDKWNDGAWASGQDVHKITFQKSKEANQDHPSPRQLEIKCCVSVYFFKITLKCEK